MVRLTRLLLVLLLVAALLRMVWRLDTFGGELLHITTAGPLPTFELDSKKQKLIWDNEHATFVIEKHFGTAFLKALVKGDSSNVRLFFRAGFRGEALSKDGAVTRQKDFLREVRRDLSASAVRPADADGMTSVLLGFLQPIQRVDRKRLRVLQIQRLSENPQRYKAKLLIDFVGVINAKNHPLLFYSEHEIECTITDEQALDKTPSIDRWSVQKEILRSSDRYLMEEATASMGLDKLPIPDNWEPGAAPVKRSHFQVAVADYNKDGWLDIAVAVDGGDPLLLESDNGKRFKNVTRQRGLTPIPNPTVEQCFVAAWLDYDNDGWPDLLLGERLYRNQKGERFEDVTEKSNLRFHKECMGAVTADYDGDGLLDLYLLYQRDHEKPPTRKLEGWVDDKESGMPNQLWRNEGGGKFRNVTAQSGAGGGNRHTFAAAWFFYDGDHRPDLYIANDFGTNVILRNRGDGTFEDVSAQSGAQDFATSMGVAIGDVDNDGRPDIYVANMFSKMGRRIIGQVRDSDYPPGIFEQIKGSCAGNRLYMRKNGKYRDVSESTGVNAVGWAFAPAMLDVDGDGWLDLYATAGFMSFTRKEPDG